METREPVAVVGAGGFIGRALVARLVAEKVLVSALVRRAAQFDPAVRVVPTGDLTPATDWAPVLGGISSVVHLAGRAHAPADRVPEDWIATEIATARHLAVSAVRAGVERVVLMSSIKVHGEATGAHPFRAEDPLAPADPYGIAKARTEAAMRDAVAGSATALAILRPPLVYGPEVKANFRALLGLVARAPALPFASLANRRSFVYVENLVDLVLLLLARKEPASGAFLARDGVDLSTPELVRRIGRHLGHTPLLLPCPLFVLRGMAGALGRGDMIGRLADSLQLDDHATRDALAWRPPVSVDDGLAATCRWFLVKTAGRGSRR